MVTRQRREHLAMLVREGGITQAEADRMAGLEPGEHLMRTGVISGSGTHRDIPRFGTDETDNDYPAPAEPWASMYRIADLMDGA